MVKYDAEHMFYFDKGDDSKMTYPNEELVRFLLEAKKNTYASGSGSSSLPSRPGVKELSYQDGEYAYLDSYFGEVHFAGQEIVWHQGKAVWGMNYFGFTADPVEGFPPFLLEALKRVPAEAPYRGPETFLQGEFAYDCRWSGEVRQFTGRETIRYKGKEMYSLVFHGGILQYA